MRPNKETASYILYCLFFAAFYLSSSFASYSQAPASPYPLKFPWAGGLNSCQFCAIDLNLDGTDDLLIFDRHGNRKLTFINNGTPGSIDYTHATEYSQLLPDFHDWVITADFNCDGKTDIFTYGTGGVRVFQNISDNTLKFKLVTDLLESFYYTGKVGILVTSVDYPAFADIDSDGDLDLLTFFGLGSYVEYHQNLSMEKYGRCDSLDFKLADPCWGKFKESEGGNRIELNANCKVQNANSEVQSARHTGSTLLAVDLNGDGVKDLILGDVDYPGLVALYNGGTRDSAIMVAQDTIFPAATKAVHLFSFPAVSNIDIDNDGLKDLLVSPFDPSLHTSDNYNCVWYYKNTGTNTLPHFEIQSEQLFRNQMMDFGSASHPVLYDINGDGLQDLFVGNDGKYDSSAYSKGLLQSFYTSSVAFFMNTGTVTAPVFNLITNDLAGISLLGIRGAYPAFGDQDGDGKPDMIVGNSDGTLILFKNSGNGSGSPEFEQPVRNWQGIDVGEFSTPQLFDLDKDGVADLVIGEKSGNLNWFRNNGTAENPVFELVTDSLGKVNVTNYMVSYDGFSTPCFSRMGDGTTFLIVGSEEGRLHYFSGIDNNLNGKFTEPGGLYEWLSVTPPDSLFGWQTSPAIGHTTDPVAFDLITGNFSGGLSYISKRSPAGIVMPGTPEIKTMQSGILKVSPNPARHTVNITCSGSWPDNSASKIFILNLYGQKVGEFPFHNNITISISELPAGIYFIRAGQVKAKLIIIHN